jgi:GntR family transcriptional regulator / MocR family aminotransferase
MPGKRSSVEVPSLGAIDRAAGHVGQQLARQFREAIAKGELKPGERLPSTRALAESLGLARGTVIEVFSQLAAEGYLEAQIGAGTRVASTLLDNGQFVPTVPTGGNQSNKLELPENVRRYVSVARALAPVPPVPFSIAVPVGAVAPDDNWRRLSNRIRATRSAAPSTYGDPRGVLTLRAAIAEYVRKSRAVICEPENVIITAGTQQGLYLAAHVLLSPQDSVWAENPAYPGLTAVLADTGSHILRVPVDHHGIDVELARKLCPHARAAFVTPSHQYPLGMPLSMTRRTALLSWARETAAWVVEDDYDSELRYAGHPFPSLQGLDPSSVIYLGTFSKVLAPSLRLGYAIVPDLLIDAFAGARALIDRHAPTSDQHVLAAFMKDGYFETHIRRIRMIYAERRTALIAEIRKEIPWVAIQPSDQGMHLVVWLPDGFDDCRIASLASSAGIVARAISPMCEGATCRPGLMLGFGGFTPTELKAAVARLRDVIKNVLVK